MLTLHQFHPNETRTERLTREQRYRAWLATQPIRTQHVAIAGEIIHEQSERTAAQQRAQAQRRR
jgi:hypothetical protein